MLHLTKKYRCIQGIIFKLQEIIWADHNFRTLTLIAFFKNRVIQGFHKVFNQLLTSILFKRTIVELSYHLTGWIYITQIACSKERSLSLLFWVLVKFCYNVPGSVSCERAPLHQTSRGNSFHLY